MHINHITQLHSIVFAIGRVTPTGVTLLGTCFLLNKPGLFATASHVANNDDKNLVIVVVKHNNMTSYQDSSDVRGDVIPVSIVKVDPVRDICILHCNQDVFSNIPVRTADDVLVSASVDIVGFPHCTDGRHVLTFQSTVIGAKVLIPSSDIKSKHLILNIQTRPGQSGSPIFRASDSAVVGMLIGSYVPKVQGGITLGGVDPHTLHQTTHAISSEYILNMI